MKSKLLFPMIDGFVNSILFFSISFCSFVMFSAILFITIMNIPVVILLEQTPNIAHGLMILFSSGAYIISTVVIRVIIPKRMWRNEYVWCTWGKLISVTGRLASTLGAKNPFRYRGYVYDTETDLASILPNIMIFVLYLGNKTTMHTFVNFSVMFILFLVSGSFLSLTSNIRTLLIDEAVELEHKLSGSKPTALFFSFQTAIIKIQSGASSLVSSAGYMVIGFTSDETAKLNEYIANGFIARDSAEYTVLFSMLFFSNAFADMFPTAIFVNKGFERVDYIKILIVKSQINNLMQRIICDDECQMLGKINIIIYFF